MYKRPLSSNVWVLHKKPVYMCLFYLWYTHGPCPVRSRYLDPVYMYLFYIYTHGPCHVRDKSQPIPLGVTFSKAQISKLERLFCHVSVKRDVRALSFELWNSIWKCHPKWDWLYLSRTLCIDRGSVYTYIRTMCPYQAHAKVLDRDLVSLQVLFIYMYTYRVA